MWNTNSESVINIEWETRKDLRVSLNGISYGSCSDDDALLFTTCDEDEDEYWLPITFNTSSMEHGTNHSSENNNRSYNFFNGNDSNFNDSLTLWGIICNLLGFGQDPCQNSSTCMSGEFDFEQYQRNSTYSDLRLSMLSNFSTAYNILSISLAIEIMSTSYDLSENDRTFCSSSLLAGMILGQLGGGALGDLIGRHKAMTFVMFLQIFASLASSCSCHVVIFSTDVSIFGVLAVWRFILGIGCGGVYPLAATLSAESSSSKEDRSKLVALTFSMQGVGYTFVPFFTWILTYLVHENSDSTWRLLLGFGSIPGLLLTLLRTRSRRRSRNVHSGIESQSVIWNKDKLYEDTSDLGPTIVQAIRSEKELFRKLLGTAGCWFLFDVLFYGNTLFQPVVLEALFGGIESVRSLAYDQTIVAVLALPGYFVSIIAMDKQSPRYIQIQGFFAMSILYLVISLSFATLSSQRVLLRVIYGSTFFFSDYGPNTTTFMLPSMTFSPECRSTLNGIAAASGKLGAFLGTILFQPTAARFGADKVLLICSFLSVVGMIMTIIGVQCDVGKASSNTRQFQQKRRLPSAPSLFDYH